MTTSKHLIHRELGLAPMEGVTTLPMRLWFALVSRPCAVGTPFLRVTPTFPTKELPWNFAPELVRLKSYVPYRLIPQLMAVEGDDFLRTATLFGSSHDVIELNCGCPSPTCVGKGAGSSLLKDPENFHGMVERISRELGPKKFAVKMRTAYTDAKEFPHLLKGLREISLARLTVHGRTRADAYRGEARWDLISQAASTCSAPVIASGDIVNRQSLLDRRGSATHVGGVIVGRGALRNPWIFEEFRRDEEVCISYEALEKSLICHALIHETYANDMAKFRDEDSTNFKLLNLVEEGLVSECCGTDATVWDRVLRRLATVFHEEEAGKPDTISVSRVTMGRLKLIWNYLRSSLPKEFASTDLLRSGDLKTFVQRLRFCNQTYRNVAATHGDELLPLRHNSEWNWLYSGERRGATAP